LEFDSIEQARDEATAALAGIAKDVLPGSVRRELSIEVRDEAKARLLRTCLVFEGAGFASLVGRVLSPRPSQQILCAHWPGLITHGLAGRKARIIRHLARTLLCSVLTRAGNCLRVLYDASSQHNGSHTKKAIQLRVIAPPPEQKLQPGPGTLAGSGTGGRLIV